MSLESTYRRNQNRHVSEKKSCVRIGRALFSNGVLKLRDRSKVRYCSHFKKRRIPWMSVTEEIFE